jgi:hypothetical protein
MHNSRASKNYNQNHDKEFGRKGYSPQKLPSKFYNQDDFKSLKDIKNQKIDNKSEYKTKVVQAKAVYKNDETRNFWGNIVFHESDSELYNSMT